MNNQLSDSLQEQPVMPLDEALSVFFDDSEFAPEEEGIDEAKVGTPTKPPTVQPTAQPAANSALTDIDVTGLFFSFCATHNLVLFLVFLFFFQ